MSNELVKPPTISELIEERFSIIKEAHEAQKHREALKGWHDTIFHKFEADDFRKAVDRSYWQEILDRSHVCDTMTDRERAEFQKKMHENPPPFDAENILAFQANAERIFIDGYKKTFETVYQTFTDCHYSGKDWSEKKRDNLQRIEKTFRFRGAFYYDARWKTWDYRDGRTTGCYSSSVPSLGDLYLVCCLLDGKPRPNYSNDFASLAREQTRKREGKIKVETEYFDATPSQNGNTLVSFKRLDILELLNKAGGTGQLPDTMRKRYKPEHWQQAA
jgi:hypothetical protein